jgi:hypothetical protein
MRRLVARLLVAFAAFVWLSTTAGSTFAQVAVPKASPAAADIEQAKNHMAAGVSFMQDPDGARYEVAYPEFRKAYELSGSLNALQNLAICSQKLELDGEAIAYYELVIEKKGPDLAENERAQIDKDLAGLKSVVAWVTLSSDKPGVTVVDERTPRRGIPIRNQYKVGLQAKKLGLHPGNHKLTASVSGMPAQEWRVQIANGGAQNHEFVFDKNAPVTADGMRPDEMGTGPAPTTPDATSDDDGIPVYVWIAGGVTVAAAVPWAIFMAQSGSKKSDYEALQGTASIAEQEDAKSSLESTNLLADVFLGITAAGAVTTTVLLVLHLTSDSGDSAKAEGPQFGVDYTVAPMTDGRSTAGAAFTASF